MGIRSPSSLSPIIASNLSFALTAIVPTIEFDLGRSQGRPWPIDTAQSTSLHLMHCPRVLAGTLPREEGGPNKVSFPGITDIVRTHIFTTDKPLTPHRNSVLVNFQPEEIWTCFFCQTWYHLSHRVVSRRDTRRAACMIGNSLYGILWWFSSILFSTSLQNFSLPSFLRAASRSMTFDTARKVCSILGVLWSVETTVSGVQFWSVYQKENRSLGKSFSRSRHLGILEFFDFTSGISAQTTQILSGHLQEVTHQDTIGTFWERENVWIDLAAFFWQWIPSL